MIADTTFIIDLLKNVPEAVKKAAELESRNENVVLTSITAFELWQGSLDLGNQEKVNRINAFIDAFYQHDFDLDSSKLAGSIHARLREAGQTIDPEDSMLAGICIHINQPLLTRNVKHFARIKELRLETY